MKEFLLQNTLDIPVFQSLVFIKKIFSKIRVKSPFHFMIGL